MAKPVLELTCKKCRGLIEVYKDDLGTQGVCPVCGTPVEFPAAKEPQKTKVKCIHCQVVINVPPDSKELDLVCPNCGKLTPTENVVTRDKGTGIILNSLGLKSSYWSLLMKAAIYPFTGSLSLIIFLLVISAVIVASIALSKLGIAYVIANLEEGHWQWIAVGAIVFLAAFVVLVALSYLCSLMIALTRKTSWANRKSPPIEGMNHRDNLYLVLTWAVFYFGLAFLLAYRSTDGHNLFLWTRPSVFLLGLLGSLAPMAFLRSDVISNTAGFNIPKVLKDILKVPGEYFGLLVVSVLVGAIYVKLGRLLYAESCSSLTGCTPNYYLGFPLQLLAIACFIAPIVITARALGIFYEYKAEHIDFQGSHRLASEKINLVLGAVTLAGLVFIGHILFVQTTGYLLQLDKTNLAKAHMMRIHRLTRGFYPGYPQNKEALFERLDLEDLEAQTLPHPEERYDIFPLKKSSPIGFIWIYEKEPVDMKNNKIHIIRHGGEEDMQPIQTITVKKRDEILKLQEEYVTQTDSEQKSLIMEKIAAAWPKHFK